MNLIKYTTLVLFIVAFGSIIIGYVIESIYSEKLIGFGVAGLFLIVFPLFSYLHWKGKDPKDYMLTKENLDKMRESQRNKKH
jgi:uncharacterized membrane protein